MLGAAFFCLLSLDALQKSMICLRSYSTLNVCHATCAGLRRDPLPGGDGQDTYSDGQNLGTGNVRGEKLRAFLLWQHRVQDHLF